MAYRDEVLADSPTAYWRFGESSGTTAVDETVNNHDGSYVGDPTLGVTGALANDSDTAVDFDGAGDVVDLGDIIDPQTGSFTVEAWVKVDDVSVAGQRIHVKEDGTVGWALSIGDSGSGAVRFFNRDSASFTSLDTPTGVVSNGVWHHIVGVYDASAGSRKIYVDAVEEASAVDDTGGFPTNTAKYGLMARTEGGVQNEMAGVGDEFAVYPSALSSSRIEYHYNYGVTGSKYATEVLMDDPTAYWRLGEASGSIAVDETVNNHDGTYRGGPTLGVIGALANDSDTAVQFDGVDDYMDVVDDAAFHLSVFTVECWFRAIQYNNDFAVISARQTSSGVERNWWVALWDNNASTAHPQGAVVARTGNSAGDAVSYEVVASDKDYWDDTWHHLVLVVDDSAGNAYLYVDGVQKDSASSADGVWTGAADLFWAEGGAGALRFLDGRVDEGAVYNSVLSSTRIQAHFDAAQAEAVVITFESHVVLLKHRPLFEGVFSPHTVVLNHFKTVPLQPHIVNLLHRGNVLKGDDSEQGQATALRKLLGYGWGVPDPAGSANEKIETPRESWPIHRFHEAERLLRQEGVEEPTAQALGDALRRLGEDIHLDVKENLQRYEWHANAHTHSALGGAGTTPIGPADSVFLCGGSLRRYRADNGNLVWSVGSNLDRMALDHVNEVIFATKQGSSSSNVDKVEAYDFGGSLVWSSDPFLNVTDSKNDHLTICLSRDRESLYMIYHKDNNEIGVIKLRTADGSVETVGSSTGFSTDGLPNNVVIDTINDFLYVTDGYGQDDGRVIKLSLGDGKFKWKTALNHSGSSSSSICATETLIWAMAGNELYALDPSDGSIVDSTLFSVNDYTGVKITKIWKDFQNSNSVYVLTASRFDPISWLHRAYLVGDTIQADEELYTFEESNADILARDAEGSFYITGGNQATTQLQIYKLNPDLSLAWQRDGNATEILTAQGRSVHWG